MTCNPKITITKTLKKRTFDVCVDACGETDFVGICNPSGDHPYSISLDCKLAEKLKVDGDSDIFHKELFAICAAVYMAPNNCSLRLFTDSQLCIYALTNGGNQDTVTEMVKWIRRTAVNKQLSMSVLWV